MKTFKAFNYERSWKLFIVPLCLFYHSYIYSHFKNWVLNLCLFALFVHSSSLFTSPTELTASLFSLWCRNAGGMTGELHSHDCMLVDAVECWSRSWTHFECRAAQKNLFSSSHIDNLLFPLHMMMICSHLIRVVFNLHYFRTRWATSAREWVRTLPTPSIFLCGWVNWNVNDFKAKSRSRRREWRVKERKIES